MRVPVPLAWLILVLGFFTAGLLRQFHERTPHSPFIAPVVGSLLFAAVFLVLLVSAREWQRGAVRGGGVRLGSLTPVLLMLLIEKWVSLALYPPLFNAWFSTEADPRQLDALYVAFGGVELLLVCLLVGRLSRPTARKTWRRSRPSRWPIAALGTALVVGATYLLLGALGWLLGGDLRLGFPRLGPTLLWILGGQCLLAFAEEVYYRGLLMSELERLAPRLGVTGPTGRRWTALLFTAVLFGMEHLTLGPPWGASLRSLTFTVSLGLLLGILLMVSANLHFCGAVHAWINWLLLGATPLFVDDASRPMLPSGTYIGLMLILAFVLAFVYQRTRRAAVTEAGEKMDL